MTGLPPVIKINIDNKISRGLRMIRLRNEKNIITNSLNCQIAGDRNKIHGLNIQKEMRAKF